MLGTRYDEYANKGANLPFEPHLEITVTSTRFTGEANWHENLELQIILEGEGSVLLDEKRHRVKKGDIVVANSNVIHHINTETCVTYSCIIIDLQFCKLAGIDPTVISFQNTFRDDEIYNKFLTASKMYYHTEDCCHIAKTRKLLLEILIALRERHTWSVSENIHKKPSVERVKAAIRHIKHNYNEKLTLDGISKAIFCNKFTLSKEFKTITKKTVIDYINDYRCKKAGELILEGVSVKEAAYRCGFNNISFFTKTFKEHIGTLPSKYKTEETV